MRITIDKMIYGGDGLARLPADGKRTQAVFVPFVLPGEEVEVSVVREKRGFARAGLSQVFSPSAHRVKPECRYFQRCGGCHYQHADYPQQLEIKAAILRETLQRTAKLEWPGEIPIHSTEPWHYRNRTRLHIHGAPAFAIGYHAPNSRRLVPVEGCPISSPLINRALVAMWEMGRAGDWPALIHEIEYFADHEDARLLVEVFIAQPLKAEEEKPFQRWAKLLRDKVPEVAGISAFVNGPTASRAVWSDGDESIEYSALDSGFLVSAGSFFQTNRFLLDDLVRTATNGAQGSVAWDLYAGVGLFSAALAKRFTRVVAVESSPVAFRDLKHNLPANGKAIRASTEEFFERAAKDEVPDLILADPPRAGIGAESVSHLVRIQSSRITYVSCDPATFARDLRGLLDGGYRLAALHLVDMFPQTYHLETVAHLEI